MECDICGRLAQGNHSLNCMTCTRSAIYPLRIDLATTLLQKEQIARRVEAVVTGDASKVPATTTLDGAIVDMRECSKSELADMTNAELGLIEERIKRITTKAAELKKEIEEQKILISENRAKALRQRSDAGSATYGLDTRITSELDQVSKTSRQTKRRWHNSHQDIIRGRISLSRKAAKLAGLTKTKIVEGQSIREVFEIAGGLPIPDILRMISTDPQVLTASLTQVAYLVSNVTQYLAIRLPAEIVLPRKDHPFPTIFPPSASYLERDGPTDPSSKSAGSRILDQRVTRPRSLSLSRSIPKMYKDDPVSFSIFVEGVALLAWNIAWLCKTQGMSGLGTTGEISAIGRNLWQLLMADHRGSVKTTESGSQTSEEHQNGRAMNPPTHFGTYSHGTAHSFMGANEAAELVRKFPGPTRVIDKIKVHIVTELQGAEWEVLDEEEWANATKATNVDEDPVLVGGRRWSSALKGKAGTSGWTRLKSRNDVTNDIKSSGASDSK